LGQVAWFHNPDEVIRKLQGRMQLHIGHVASYAISGLPLVRVHALAVVACMALLVIETGVISPRVLVCRMACRARELTTNEAPALH
jgi:hypothetical protein